MATILAVGLYAYHDGIKSFTKRIFDEMYYSAYRDVLINKKQNPKMTYAIKQYIVDRRLSHKHHEGVDGYNGLNYNIDNGTYKSWYCVPRHKNDESRDKYHLWISINDDEIYLTVDVKISNNIFHKYIDEIYNKYCVPENITTYFTSNEDKWSYPIIRRSRNITQINLNNNMNIIANDVHEFICSQNTYVMNGLLYRQGYLFKGKSGTGKTTMIEYISLKYNRCVYMINLNSNTMCDSTLINLLSAVPPNSIIVFEEIDRQLETLRTNKQVHISEGGILTAIDGPTRLSHGTIVIMTSNESYDFNDNFKQALFRHGRIDKIYELV